MTTKTATEIEDWAPTPGDLRFRLVFYKKDFLALLGWAKRTVDFKVATGEFPAPDFYDGASATWTRETVYNWIKERASADRGRRAFGGKS